MLKWIIIIVLLLLLGGGGYFAYTKFLGGADNATQTASENPNAQVDARPGDIQMVTLPTFLVNLADPLGRRYLKMTLDVELVNKAAAEELNKQTPKVRDAIILLLSSKSYADLATPESKLLLKNEVVERLNLILGGARVRNVYFTDMVIQ
ncbi:MAG: flagellar basal body-associated FliL family protein [Desulfovibrio sp.]|nr:flagellar basal body-associated FliL family protein [Desulfovibrio sp.]MCA1986398.1 flagellar basal body-associated FliL family protein [Desulfovibrio sp.]